MKYSLTIEKDRERFMKHAIRLMKKNANADLTEKFPPKTIKQNAYLHVLITYIAIETGETIKRTKRMLKRQRLDIFEFIEDGYKHLRSCSDLDTKEESQFCEWIRSFASIELGIYLMTPEEYRQNKHSIEKEIEQKTMYTP